MRGEELSAGKEGIDALNVPGAEEGGEGDLGGGAVGGAGTTGDLAAGDEVAEAALGSIVVGWDTRLADERQELAEVPAFAPVVIEAWQYTVACEQCGERTAGAYPAGLEPQR